MKIQLENDIIPIKKITKIYYEFFFTGIFFSVFPFYSFISWVFIFNQYPNVDQSERVNKFRGMIFNFPFSISILNVINITLSVIAILFLTKCIGTKNSALKIISIIIIPLLIFILLYNIWGLL